MQAEMRNETRNTKHYDVVVNTRKDLQTIGGQKNELQML